MTVAIRPATPSDIPTVRRLIRALAEYEKKLHLATATEDDLRTLLFSPRPYGFAALAELNNVAAGILIWYFMASTFAGRPALFVEDVFVEPAHRGKGIGLALFRHAAKIARAENCVCMEWRVLNWNQAAIDFYHRLGAKESTEWKFMMLEGGVLVALSEGASDA